MAKKKVGKKNQKQKSPDSYNPVILNQGEDENIEDGKAIDPQKVKDAAFVEKAKSVGVKTDARTFVLRPVRLQVRGRPVMRMRKVHMNKA